MSSNLNDFLSKKNIFLVAPLSEAGHQMENRTKKVNLIKP